MHEPSTGDALRRVEDRRLLTGQGRYTDDVAVPDGLVMVFFRSPYAHGEIRRLELSAARAASGVEAVIAIEDLDAAGIRDPQPAAFNPETGSAAPVALPQPALARGRVRYVGEPVAAVVARTQEQALDAIELIDFDVAELPAVASLAEALADDAATLWPEEAPGNVLGVRTRGDAGATERAFARAAHMVEIELVNNRVSPVTMEPRGCLAVPAAAPSPDAGHDGAGAGASRDADNGGAADDAQARARADADPAAGAAGPFRLTLHMGTQGVHNIARDLAAALDMPPEALRVVTGDVGGGFGLRLFLQGEPVVTAFAAMRLGQPVRWIATRGEAFLSDLNGRDHRSHAALALDEDLRFIGLRVRTASNLGAYSSQMGANIAWFGGSMVTGAYDIPAAFAETLLVVSNTAPTDAYRGAGRPEASYLIERLVDRAARVLGVSPLELRRRNFIAADAFPYESALGQCYDSGDYRRLLDAAWERADGAGFEARRRQSADRGLLRGIGVAFYVEVCAGYGRETAEVRLREDGAAEVRVGTQSTGQGHETAYAQLVSRRLGIDPERVRVLQGDTAEIAAGGGTGGSRTLAIGGSAVKLAVEQVLEAGARLAAHLMECDPQDVALTGGRFRIAGTDRSVTFDEVVAASFEGERLPAGVEEGLRCTGTHPARGGTFPNGCHVCEVEVDPETGRLRLLRHTIEDDMGRVINPLLLEGQIVGGAVQGLSQALLEQVVYEPGTGQLQTGSFVDYALVRAGDLGRIDFHCTPVPSPRNPLGVKGAGEAGTIGAPAALVNAVLDALAPVGVEDIDMPLTPMRVWEALRRASA